MDVNAVNFDSRQSDHAGLIASFEPNAANKTLNIHLTSQAS